VFPVKGIETRIARGFRVNGSGEISKSSPSLRKIKIKHKSAPPRRVSPESDTRRGIRPDFDSSILLPRSIHTHIAPDRDFDLIASCCIAAGLCRPPNTTGPTLRRRSSAPERHLPSSQPDITTLGTRPPVRAALIFCPRAKFHATTPRALQEYLFRRPPADLLACLQTTSVGGSTPSNRRQILHQPAEIFSLGAVRSVLVAPIDQQQRKCK